MALTGRTRLKNRMPFLMRTGASVGGDLDDQGCGELGDFIPGEEEGAGAADWDAGGQVRIWGRTKYLKNTLPLHEASDVVVHPCGRHIDIPEDALTCLRTRVKRGSMSSSGPH